MRYMLLILMLCLTGIANASELEKNLLNKISQAKVNLAETEKTISADASKLGQELARLEQTVIKLRDKTAVARRKNDERTLGVNQLEQRLSQWKKQQSFQNNLLDRYLQQQGVKFTELTQTSFTGKLKQVKQQVSKLDSTLKPSWNRQTIVLNNGETTQANTLKVGPVNWFIAPTYNLAGLLNKQNGLLTTALYFDSSEYQTMMSLVETGKGNIQLDPTLGRAITKQQAKESVSEHLIKGGIWVLPIVAFAIIATLIAVCKVIQFIKLPHIIRVTSVNTLNSATRQLKGMQKNLYAIAESALNPDQRDDQLFFQLQQDKHKLEKWVNTIAVTAAVAPLLGLLGTVSGMIETFQMMTSFGSSDPEIISGGIAKALVTTELGLVVAIPALIINAVLSRKAKRYYEDLENFALVLSCDHKDQREALA